MTYLLDSVILIDHFNGVPQATRFLERHGSDAAISAITRAEVLAGFDDDDAPHARLLLDRLRFLPMDARVADEAARLRRRTRLKLPDAIQAAFAAVHGLKLATRNVKDFAPGRFGFVVEPYRLR
ncbi:MAG: PIN domain-containing protein [Pseudomonadota bacterium]